MNRRRSERGAAAVLFALLSVVMLSIAALGVDLGNAWAQKRQVTAGGDLATEAGAGLKAANMPNTGAVTSCGYGAAGAVASSQAVKDIASYLAEQAYPQPRSGADATAYTVMQATLPAQLTDCNMANGEVVYGLPKRTGSTWSVTYNKNQLSLVTPPKQVNFGFAQLMGFSNTKVYGVSTVEIKSPKMATLPFYGFTGCDYGPQTLQQPNNGQSASTVMLANPTDPSPASSNTATLTAVSPSSYPVDNSPTLEPITLTGTNLTGVTDIGFFESGNATTGPAPVTSQNFSVNAAGTQITMPDIPSQARGVAGVQEFWYIRVKKNGQWSSVYVGSGNNLALNTPILTIGDPPLVCGQGSSAGNFGTIKLSHAGYTGWDSIGAANVAIGLDSTLAIYPVASRDPSGTCTSAQPASVFWTADGTNCVDTDTGMSANVATGGFLGLGSSRVNGGADYLLKPNHKTNCGPGGTEALTSILGQSINNDTLTCFFTDPNVHVGDIDTDPLSGGYAGPPVISDKIYDSPRFGYVPILPVQPVNGGSNKYQIIDFRACFITDQPASAVKGDPPSATNGINMDSNGVHSVQLIFLNPNALPNPPVKNGTINYVGTGAKIPVLVN